MYVLCVIDVSGLLLKLDLCWVDNLSEKDGCLVVQICEL